MQNLEEIMEGIKNGASFTIACSMYEETFWLRKDGFGSTFDNGADLKVKNLDEATVRSRIQRAITNPNKYDAFFE